MNSVSTEIPRFKIDVILWHAIERLNLNHQPADLTGILEEMRSNGRMLTREEIVKSLEYLDATGQVTRTSDNQYASTTTLRGRKVKFGNRRIDVRRILCYLLLLQTLVLFSSVSVQAQSGTPSGSFTFTLKGYTLKGELTNAVINPDKSVNMTMSIEASLSTPLGAIPVRGVASGTELLTAAWFRER